MKTKKNIENLFNYVTRRSIYIGRQGKVLTAYEQGVASTLRWIVKDGPSPEHSLSMSECPPSFVLDQDIGKL